MSQIVVDTELCVKDGVCVEVCPSRTLQINEHGFPEENPEYHCILCGHCVAVCVCGAIVHNGLPQEPLTAAAKELPAPAIIDNFLNSRRSVREFKEKPVAKETLEALLDVARRAPTASNSQKLHWIVVPDAAKVHAVAAETANWIGATDSRPALMKVWDKGYDFVLRGAPTLVVACTPADYEWGKQDCAIALTFMELAAEARGLGVCWAGYLTRAAAVHAPLNKLLSVPAGYQIHGGLMLGEPKYKYRSVPPRKSLSVQWL
jgi:nitroreductase/NAD-dependent dihydropyrimidine dehydrogenase PreA subunit